jgi:low temperature requirement protein LtrA
VVVAVNITGILDHAVVFQTQHHQNVQHPQADVPITIIGTILLVLVCLMVLVNHTPEDVKRTSIGIGTAVVVLIIQVVGAVLNLWVVAERIGIGTMNIANVDCQLPTPKII